MERHDTPTTTGATRALAQYRQEQVNGLGQKELLLMLYDGAIRFCEEGKAAINEGDANTSYHRLIRARDVVRELWAILDAGVEHEVVTNLQRLYEFCVHSITEVNFSKNVKLLDAVIEVLVNLRAGWAELDFAGAMGEAATAPTAPPPAALPEAHSVSAETPGLSLTG